MRLYGGALKWERRQKLADQCAAWLLLSTTAERERAAHVVQVTVLVDSRLAVSTALHLWVSERLAYSFAAAWMSTDRMNSLTNQPPTKVLTKGGDLRGAQVYVPWSA